ncbi:hypothetical protein NHU_04099 [Rhodovulum sulfidophilum]|uniref:Uncharacterized protein n=1 Tax=Rhodovulum sulfidophilum TaxID=35806 RepID=A0A0D6B880_RHOSU|nr:hypothetical protein NHU_04099 [Rhodovulum sulfidophilum]
MHDTSTTPTWRGLALALFIAGTQLGLIAAAFHFLASLRGAL